MCNQPVLIGHHLEGKYRMKPEILARLKEIAGNNYVFTEKEDLFCYTYDGCFLSEKPKLPGVKGY